MRVSDDGLARRAHLHLMSPGEQRWEDQRRFRDRLRSDARLRDEYARLKTAAAARYRNDREAYTQAKTRFVLDVLSER